jgi:hypothetical protein
VPRSRLLQICRRFWNRHIRGQTRLPDFLCVGAQKAGTTTLYHWLAQHPDLVLPEEKELHYFSLHAQRPPDWYAAWFPRCSASQKLGEVTPYYLFHPHAAARISHLLPQARLIVLLRDPVERALSGYFHSRRLGLEPLEIEAAFAAEEHRLVGADALLGSPDARHPSHQHHSYLSRSRYEQQLARYQNWFSPSQLLLLRTEDLFGNPQREWERILTFLGVPQVPLQSPEERKNAGGGESLQVTVGFREQLRQQLAPTYQALRNNHGLTWDESRHG